MSAESKSADIEDQGTDETTEAVVAEEVVEQGTAGAEQSDEDTASPEAEAKEATPEADATAEVAADAPEETAPAGEALERIRGAMQSGKAVRGQVTGSGDDGLDVVVDGITSFCAFSEMEIGDARDAKEYMEQSYDFFVLRIEDENDRVVLSRVSHLRQELKSQQQQAPPHRQKIEPGAVLTGKVVTIKDFGAFVDVGGTQGLVHISELARRRVEKTEDVVQPGDDVQVKVLKVDKGGRRISLSMRALEPDPWKDAADKYITGMTVEGIVEKVERFGAFIQLEPGLSGLLPGSKMMIPRDSSPARVFPPGRRLNVKIISIEPRRQRISLGLEGDASEGSREDYESFKQSQGESAGGFNALAAALSKLEQ